ncbi:sulfatase [uncultured Kriegella sp.]|uniref:sulfatase family protein n=1 Tax=uncultured Kriegella sp. TaxID=1798910 RepID=UPI0030D92737|tara:strand:+ start:34287 stop:35909 length:1623 start_codon:yes stop_codon:yes gene_type:complete
MKHLTLFFIASILMLGCADNDKNQIIASTEELPNIVWLVAEDQSPDFFPMYGDSTISLPNLEALASDGVVFTNAYAPVPVCAPTRSGIITGMYPTTLGTHNMRTYSGDNSNQMQIGIPSYSPVVPKGTVMFPQLLRKRGYYTSNNSKEDYNFKKLESVWDESSKNAHWRNRPKGAPFFSVFNFIVCHESGIWKQRDSELFVTPDSVSVPSYFPDNEIIRHDLAVNYSNLKRMDDQAGEIIAQLKEDGLYDNTIIFFYADHGGPFPRHKRALYETGTKVPLVIKFPENEKAGERNDNFINFIDFAPTLLSWAGLKPPKTMQGKALYGKYRDTLKSKYIFTTSDRFDGVYDRLRGVRSQRYKYIKNFNQNISNALPVVYREQMPMMQKMNKMWKNGELDATQSLWFRTPKPEEELYDLQNDPYELENLADRAELRDTLKHLRGILKDWIIDTHDLGVYPEKELLAKWLPKGKQLKLAPLEMEKKVSGVALYSHRPDATILYKQPQDSVWQFYREPLPGDTSFVAKAERIGFEDSDLLKYTLD